MKKIHLAFLPLFLLVLFSACEKTSDVDTIDCENGDCLFVLEEVNGQVILMNCFSRLAIQTSSPDTEAQMIFGIPDQDLPEHLATPETEVIFTAKFRANTLEPQFPDPNIGPESIYQIELMEVRKKE